MKGKIFFGLAVAICAMIIYPLIDLLWCLIITKSTFSYSVPEHVVSPLIIGIIAGLILYKPNKKEE